MKRRDFISKSALSTLGTMFVPSFLKAFEQNSYQNNHNQYDLTNLGDKIIVILQLSGGNDGLNTVIPFKNDIYYQSRPKIAIQKDKILPLTDEIGLNPALLGLKKLYDEGLLGIFNGVGYPSPDRSHFRSMDIWHTASASNEYLQTGWLGRYLDAQCDTKCLPYQAIEIDDTLSLALKGEKLKALAMQDIHKFYRLTRSKSLQKINDKNIIQTRTYQQTHQQEHQHENVAYLYKTLAETVSSADYINEKTTKAVKTATNQADYPKNNFAPKLKNIAQMINAGLETRVYYAELSGFDTHAGQLNRQAKLHTDYADSVYAFVQDLKKTGNLDKTVILTFSEFGRRVVENGSGGTDHGTANNLFVIGGKLKKAGIYNPMPSLTDLNEGDLKHNIDFRSIYATVLEKQLGQKHQHILGNDFDILDFL